MRAAEIRELFLSFFEERSHLRVPSASLVPASYDPSVLLTTAGMQPFKPYFRGEEEPPSRRLTSCQKVFRATDIENVGLTARHLTFFEMLGNFSVGDYFKQGAAEMAWELSTRGFGFAPETVWITVFGGDEELGLGADDEAIECWRAIGVPDERIVRLGREDNFWQSGPTGPCGPCSELYLDRGPAFGTDDDRPGDDTERYLEFWNLVFMQYELRADSSLAELPQKNIDTGMGLDRMAAVLQDVPSVYETDSFRPAGGVRRAALGPPLRAGRRHHARAARAGRPRPRGRVPAGRRRGAFQRGSRLHPAPDPPARDPPGPLAGHRRPVRGGPLRRGGEDDGGRLSRSFDPSAAPSTAGRRRRRRASRERSPRASGCWPSSWSAREPTVSPTRSPPRTPSGCTTPSGSRSR